MKLGLLECAAATVCVLLTGVTLTFNAPPLEPTRPSAPAPQRPAANEWFLQRSAQSRNVRYTTNDADGRYTWDLYATSLDYEKEARRVKAEGVRCTLLERDGQTITVVEARGAVLDTTTMDVRFAGQVNAHSPAGDTLTVRHLFYSGHQKKFFGQGGVRITRGRTVLVGDRMVGDPSLRHVTVSGHASAAAITDDAPSPADAGSTARVSSP